MRTKQIKRTEDMMLDSVLQATIHNVAGHFVLSSSKTYTYDTQHFVQWIKGS